MKPATHSLIRYLLTQHAQEKIAIASKPGADVRTIQDVEHASASLVDFLRDASPPPMPAATDTMSALGFTAIDVLTGNARELRELDVFFASGNGKGSRTHKTIQRLMKIAEDARANEPAETLTEEAPEPQA